ncbi:MAG: diaminopimelate decarboxylase [Candidatus Atribacteria bacterium]|nr:diaminopimelate decarboxylase [Candidatus Atribacteria bacterium]
MLGNKNINDSNHLQIAGCDVVELAQTMGTPLYVYDEDLIRDNIQEYKQSFQENYPHFSLAYAGKAFLCSALCSLLDKEGWWVDVVSGGEYYLASAAGFPVERIIFHGNNKTPEERRLVLQGGVGRWVVDNEVELNFLLEEASSYTSYRVPLFFRLIPGVDPHTHQYITTGKIDSKFGLPLGEAENVILKALQSEDLEVKGLHCHIGSQIDQIDPFLKAAEIMLQFMADFRKKYDFVFQELDLGGGLGVPYLDEEKGRFPSFHFYVRAICEKVKSVCDELSYPLPHLYIEPGRSVVNTAGSTIYRVGSVKEIPGVKKYVAVDGGMADNPRPILYGAKYQARIGNRVIGKKERVSVVGKCCESGDVLIEEIELPSPSPGDILVVEATGAYNHSMASNYNLIPRPGVVFLRGGKPELVVRPENWYDLVRRDIIPGKNKEV